MWPSGISLNCNESILSSSCLSNSNSNSSPCGVQPVQFRFTVKNWKGGWFLNCELCTALLTPTLASQTESRARCHWIKAQTTLWLMLQLQMREREGERERRPDGAWSYIPIIDKPHQFPRGCFEPIKTQCRIFPFNYRRIEASNRSSIIRLDAAWEVFKAC